MIPEIKISMGESYEIVHECSFSEMRKQEVKWEKSISFFHTNNFWGFLKTAFVAFSYSENAVFKYVLPSVGLFFDLLFYISVSVDIT
jgi:hypothetical protein